MKATEDRTIGRLTVQIDRRICVGFETCIEIAPDVFRCDDDGIATFLGDQADVPTERLLEACGSCPVDALLVSDEEGKQLVP